MAGKDIIMATQEELKKLHIIRKALDGMIRHIEAADILSLSDRQIRRLTARVRQEGDTGIVHKSRGKESNRRLPDRIRKKIVNLYRQKYNDFGPTLLSEKLFEEENIKISDETIRLWLVETGDRKKRRKHKKHRQWRERKHHFGEMIQIDGSHHEWFEGRGDKCVFMGYIDDATGKIFGRFYEYEGTIPAMDSFKSYIKQYGMPMSVYLDKHTTYKSPGKPTIEDELNGTEPLSEFERALKELGVEVIHANSPQAKGRIERLFKTLQDRLIKEMRLNGIKTIQEANIFLQEYMPKHNKRFAVEPMEEEDLHREIPKGLDIDSILCIKTERVLRNDFTIAHNCKLYQIEDNIRTKKVTIEERLNGTLTIIHKGVSLTYKEIETRPERPKNSPLTIKRPKYISPKDHPWRRFSFGKHDMNKQKELKEATT